MTNTHNVSTKKGFTMIELIFVIVIIGILAAVAIPRLAATRDDAKVSACSQDVATLMQDLSSYYTSQGGFAETMKAMTNVELKTTADLSDEKGTIEYACDNPDTAAVKFVFATASDANGNQYVEMNASATDTTRGTVDGDLGYLLSQKNIVDATKNTARSHAISGIRVKR
jgi:general secretion pathway protein G